MMRERAKRGPSLKGLWLRLTWFFLVHRMPRFFEQPSRVRIFAG
jgi:hypothetical protein